jgi:hypothetical protein
MDVDGRTAFAADICFVKAAQANEPTSPNKLEKEPLGKASCEENSKADFLLY